MQNILNQAMIGSQTARLPQIFSPNVSKIGKENLKPLAFSKNRACFVTQDSKMSTRFTSRNSTLAQTSIKSLLSSKRGSMDRTLYNNQSKCKKNYQTMMKMQKQFQNKVSIKKKIKKRNNVDAVNNHEAVTLREEKQKDKSTCRQLILPQMFIRYKMGTKIMNNFSTTSIFSAYRNGATIVALSDQLYLYGGCPWKQNDNKLYLHKYDTVNRQNWQQLSHKGEMPLFSSSNHTCETYKNYLLFIGGYGAMSISTKTRFYSKAISIYNTETSKWSRIDWKESLRGHSSVLYDNIVIVYGGIKQNEKYSSSIHFIVLNPNNITQSTSFSFDMKSHSVSPVRAIAYHQMVHSYDVDLSLRQVIKFNGVYMFGGKSENLRGETIMNNNLSFFNPKCHQNKFLENKVKGWETLITQGRKPEARYKHTLNILNRQAVLVLVGGINFEQQVLNDVWVLDLVYLNWIAATYTNNKNPINIKGISAHCSAVIDSNIYLFGGMNCDSQIITQLIKIGTKVDDSNQDFQQLDKFYTIKSKKQISPKRFGDRLLSIVLFDNRSHQ